MSLTSALGLSFSSLSLTENQLDVAASNITNADKAGYTRKSYEADYVTNGSVSTPVSGSVVTDAFDSYLFESMLEDLNEASYYDVLATYMSNYSERLGSTSDDSTLSSTINDLISSFETLAQTPEDSALKASVVQDAEMLAYEIRNLSDSVQDLRLQADNEIEAAVDAINQALETIDSLNESIASAEVTGQSTSNLEDERRVALETLSQYMNVDYYTDSNNQMNIYTNGQPLISGSSVYELSFTGTNVMNSSMEYPGALSGITVNGTDITSYITTGELGALIELRDETLVEEQEKLDALASTLITETNALLNTGVSLPARNEITGDVSDISLTDSFSASGSISITTIDSDGVITASADIDLSTLSTMSDVVNAINTAMSGSITATLSTNGELVLTADNSAEGIAIDQSDSLIGTSDNFGSYFGLNNLFSGNSASNIALSDYLSSSSDYLATSSLSSTTVGDTGVYVGDGSLASSLSEIFSSDVSFNAAGDFAAQDTSLSNYAIKIMSAIATAASNSSDAADSAASVYEQTSESLINLTGVNVDEEMANIVELQSQYETAATLISIIQEMFDTLVGAIN